MDCTNWPRKTKTFGKALKTLREQHAAYLPTVQAPISFFQLRRHNRLADLGIDQNGISWNNYVALNQKLKKKEKRTKTRTNNMYHCHEAHMILYPLDSTTQNCGWYSVKQKGTDKRYISLFELCKRSKLTVQKQFPQRLRFVNRCTAAFYWAAAHFQNLQHKTLLQRNKMLTIDCPSERETRCINYSCRKKQFNNHFKLR